MTASFATFQASIGTCAIAWGEDGIAGSSLPHSDESRLRARMRRRHRAGAESTPPAKVAAAIEAIRALLAGEARDLREVDLDMSGVEPFDRRVYEVARTIDPGATLTYGAIATRLGAPREAREVGAALGGNPFPIIVPCHRVLAADGRPGGFSAPGGVATKLRLLAIEGVSIPEQPALFA